MNIVFLDAESVGDTDLSPLRQHGKLQCYSTTESKANIADKLVNADIVISNKVPLDETAMQHAARLKLICVAATGYNNVDITTAKRRSIQVSNVAGYSTNSVAQHVMAMLLNWSIKLSQYQQAIKDRNWQKSELFCLLDYPIFELSGLTFGIIGYGAIGQAAAKLAKAFGMRVIVAERPNSDKLREGRVTFEKFLKEADIISLHCPLTENTNKLVNADFLKQMKKDAILINTARGGLIDETALYKALLENQIQAALLDGLAIEPPSSEHILLNGELDNLVITPHTAWASAEARQTLINEIALNIADFKLGKARNKIA